MKNDNRSGFNLIEVALAVFVMALGLTALFALFPTGLGMADTAREETQVAMFADYVFGAIRVRADAGGDTWINNVILFRNTVEFNSQLIREDNGAAHTVEHHPAGERLVRFPAHTDAARHQTFLRYTLDLGLTGTGNRIGTATLKVRPGRAGGQESIFYTEFYPFMPMVQP